MSRLVWTPRGYQSPVIDHILSVPRCAVWAGMGLGKTVSTLTALEMLRMSGDSAPILVLAPLRVAQSVWRDEARKWHHLRDLSISTIVGTDAERKSALRRRADIYTMNFENLPWLLEYWGKRWPYRTVVVDESTRLKGFRTKQGTARSRALGRVAHTGIDRIIELTGTPSPNGLQDLWGQMWFIDRGERLGSDFKNFSRRWFQRAWSGYGLDPLPHTEAEIHALLADVCYSVRAEDWFDLEEPIVNNIYVDLPPASRAVYTEMEKRMFAEIEGHEITAVNAASRTNKCLQLANGAAYTDDTGNWVDVHDAKLDALEEVIEEASGAPVLVAYHFKSDIARMKRRFPQGRHLDKNPKTIDEWNAGRIPVLFAHPQSAGHGLNLQDGGNILCFFGHNWNLEDRLQILERIGPVRQMQSGHKRSVFIHNIIARDTVDELVLERIETKREVQDILLDAMRRKAA